MAISIENYKRPAHFLSYFHPAAEILKRKNDSTINLLTFLSSTLSAEISERASSSLHSLKRHPKQVAEKAEKSPTATQTER